MDKHTARRATPDVERNGRRARWFHTLVYVPTFVLLATGWWLLSGREGDPSPLARLSGIADVELHKNTGWLLAAVCVVAVVAGSRGIRTFVAESLKYRREELGWFRAWPRACVTGRFGRHTGHFDPGQRVANLAIAGSVIILVGSGIGLVVVHGGPGFVWLLRVHRWATYILTPVIAGHVIVAAGLLPGYRGVWRAMHRDGRVSEALAHRLWPEWTNRMLGKQGVESQDRGRLDE